MSLITADPIFIASYYNIFVDNSILTFYTFPTLAGHRGKPTTETCKMYFQQTCVVIGNAIDESLPCKRITPALPTRQESSLGPALQTALIKVCKGFSP